MGVDANLYLPADMDPRFVSAAVAILIGAKKTRDDLGVSISPTDNAPESEFELKASLCTNIPQMCNIGPYSFHWCARVRTDKKRKKFTAKLGNLMIARSNPTTIAVFRGLAKAFGGLVIPQDHNPETFEEYARPKATKDDMGLQPEDDPYWDPFQDYIFNIKPLTARELVEANELSAYQWEERKKDVKEYKGWHDWAWKLLKA